MSPPFDPQKRIIENYLMHFSGCIRIYSTQSFIRFFHTQQNKQFRKIIQLAVIECVNYTFSK